MNRLGCVLAVLLSSTAWADGAPVEAAAPIEEAAVVPVPAVVATAPAAVIDTPGIPATDAAGSARTDATTPPGKAARTTSS